LIELSPLAASWLQPVIDCTSVATLPVLYKHSASIAARTAYVNGHSTRWCNTAQGLQELTVSGVIVQLISGDHSNVDKLLGMLEKIGGSTGG
jgi:hypothetical protein